MECDCTEIGWAAFKIKFKDLPLLVNITGKTAHIFWTFFCDYSNFSGHIVTFACCFHSELTFLNKNKRAHREALLSIILELVEKSI